eukprot:gene31592-38181_t
MSESSSSQSSIFRKALTSAFVGATVFSSSVGTLPSEYVKPFAPLAAVADFRAQQKSTFFRFSPKLVTGRDFFRTEVKQAIEKEDWAVVSKFFEVYASKINKNDPNQVDQYDTYANNNLYRPMKVLAGSFAERSSSAKTKALLEQESAFESAMSDLEGCVKDRKGEGFFAATKKAPTGKERTKQAKDAWARGMAALDQYVKILNEGLMLELNKVPV